MNRRMFLAAAGLGLLTLNSKPLLESDREDQVDKAIDAICKQLAPLCGMGVTTDLQRKVETIAQRHMQPLQDTGVIDKWYMEWNWFLEPSLHIWRPSSIRIVRL
jgi:hypothetical protein